MTAGGSSLTVSKADAVTLLVSAGTSFNGPDEVARPRGPRRDGGGDSPARGRAKVSYADLVARHVADHQRLFRRVALDLGAAPGAADLDHRRAARPIREGRGRSRARHAALPVRALPADRQLAPRRAARQPAGHLERLDAAALELQLDAQHQHRDELLAGRGREPRRVPRAAPRLRRGARGERTAHGRGQLRRARLGRPPQRRPLGPDRAGRELRPRRSQVGELAAERRVAQHAPVGALRLRARPSHSCASAPGRS